MVTNSASDIASNSGPDESLYTGFTICAPNESRVCRLIRGRRYRPGNPGGMRRVVAGKHLAILSNVLAAVRPPPGWTDGGALTKIAWAIASAVYLVVAFAYATSFNVVAASAVYMAVSSWIASPCRSISLRVPLPLPLPLLPPLDMSVSAPVQEPATRLLGYCLIGVLLPAIELAGENRSTPVRQDHGSRDAKQ